MSIFHISKSATITGKLKITTYPIINLELSQILTNKLMKKIMLFKMQTASAVTK